MREHLPKNKQFAKKPRVESWKKEQEKRHVRPENKPVIPPGKLERLELHTWIAWKLDVKAEKTWKRQFNGGMRQRRTRGVQRAGGSLEESSEGSMGRTDGTEIKIQVKKWDQHEKK